MPSCSKAKNPRGINITFTEADHIYKSLIDGVELKYTSGTQFLGKFYAPFDPDGSIAARCAKREGITVEEIQEKWAAKGRESCRLGTRTHEVCEDIEQGREIRNKAEDEKEEARFRYASELATKLKKSIDILGVEKIIFSDRLPTPIAGTIDLFGRSRKTGEYLILDWKTNKKIELENEWDNYCLDPISHIPDISFGHYSLQLSLYQYLLEFEGYVPRGSKFKRALLHVTENGSEIIQCPDYTKEIRDMIIWQQCDHSHHPEVVDKPINPFGTTINDLELTYI